MGSFLSAGGKSRSQTSFAGGPLKPIDRNLVSVGGSQRLSNELVRQLSEALRTGGVGAQIPIIGQAVSAANQATSSALRDTQGSLASSGLARTPYGQRILADTRLSGAQQAARIPTDIAQSFIAQTPQYSLGLLGTILSSLQKTTSRSAPYSG